MNENEASDAPASPFPTKHQVPGDGAALGSPTSVGAFPPRSASSPTMTTSAADGPLLPSMSEEEVEKVASNYRRLLREGVSALAVHYRMRRDGFGTNKDVLRAVFGNDMAAAAVDKDYFSSHVDEEQHRATHLSYPALGVPRHSAQAQEMIEYWKQHKVDKHKGRLELVDPKRADQIALALKSFSDMTFNELAEAIDCLAPMKGNRVFVLDELVPTEEERHGLLGFCGRDEEIAASSRWLRRSLAIPEMETKVKVIQVMETFNDKADKLSEQFQLVERASDQVLDNNQLKKLLLFVLRVGTDLMKNTGSDSSEVPSATPTAEATSETGEEEGRMTVFDFVVRCAVSKEHRSLALMSDLPDCEAASRIQVQELVRDVSELSKALEMCKSELKEMKRDDVTTAHWFATGVSLHEGVNRLERFVADSCVRFSKLEFDRDMALASLRKLAEFCNVKAPQESTACLALITKFAQDLDHASRKYFEREYATWKKSLDTSSLIQQSFESPAAIDKRHLCHVKSMVAMYDSLLGQKNPDPDAQEARQLSVMVISLGPTVEEQEQMVDSKPFHRVKSLVHLYNAILADKEAAYSSSNNGVQEEPKGRDQKPKSGGLIASAPKDAPIKASRPTGEQVREQKPRSGGPISSAPRDAPIDTSQSTLEQLREQNIDRRHLRHVKSVVGANGELLIKND